MDQFLADVKKVYEETGNCLVAVSEGIHYADGTFVSEAKTSATDGFGHAQLGGLAALLADRVKQALGVKVRGIELSLLQRCGAHLASQTDISEAYAAGKAAVEAAVAGQTDQMVALDCTRDDTGYRCRTKLVPLTQAANAERKVPRAWINEAGNGVLPPLRPLCPPPDPGGAGAPPGGEPAQVRQAEESASPPIRSEPLWPKRKRRCFSGLENSGAFCVIPPSAGSAASVPGATAPASRPLASRMAASVVRQALATAHRSSPGWTVRRTTEGCRPALSSFSPTWTWSMAGTSPCSRHSHWKSREKETSTSSPAGAAPGSRRSSPRARQRAPPWPVRRRTTVPRWLAPAGALPRSHRGRRPPPPG